MFFVTDIATDNIFGVEFAKKLNDWLTSQGEKHSAIGAIMKNPEKSKHLETATMNFRGFSIDFVNLRTETYSDESRIPSTLIGTPSEDAFRRDLTINRSLIQFISQPCLFQLHSHIYKLSQLFL